jgi:dihydrofolate reductase
VQAQRKLVESTFITLDGVIGNPQDWSGPYWDDEHHSYARDILFSADELLLGRRTYEGFADAWSARPSEPFTDRINALPKHVATRTLTETPKWNASVLGGDLAESVAELKRRPGANIVKYGTGELDRTLIEQGLIDELHLWVFPVIAGSGERLLDGIVDVTHLKLLRATPFASGIVVHVYGPQDA